MKTGTEVSFEIYRGDAAENYERYFVPMIGRPVADELLEAAGLRLGERVLDLACGTGVIARLAAARVGGAGAVTGVDINPGMLAVARSVPAEGAPIEWHDGAAEELPLPDSSFDAALCQLGLQFFRDRTAGLREMRRVLVAAGRGIASVPKSKPELFSAVEETVEAHLGRDAADFLRLVFSIDGRELGDLFRSAGFDDVETRTSDERLRLAPPPDFLWQYVYSTPLAAAAQLLDEQSRADLEREVVEAWRPFTHDGVLMLELEMAIAKGRR